MKTKTDARLADYRIRELEAAKAVLERPDHYPPSQVEWARKLVERALQKRGTLGT